SMACRSAGLPRADDERARVLRCEDCRLVGLGDLPVDRVGLVRTAGMDGHDPRWRVTRYENRGRTPAAGAWHWQWNMAETHPTRQGRARRPSRGPSDPGLERRQR